MQETDPDYYAVRMAIEVLSGGMSGRLFTEVREKRGVVLQRLGRVQQPQGNGQHPGVCRHQQRPGPGDAGLRCWRIASPADRASPGDELDRAKIGLKASTIMQGESTSARAAPLPMTFSCAAGSERWTKSSPPSTAVTVEQVNAYLKAHEPGPFTIVTVGPKELKLP